jgi:mannose-6-phosphate isomerase-like protein (cupin superfamily)
MKRIKSNMEKTFNKDEFFMKILHTSKYLQIAVMRLKPGAEIHLDTHISMDQFFGFKGGNGKCIVGGHEYLVENGDVIIIPADSRDEVIKFDRHKKAKSTIEFFNFNQRSLAGNKARNVLKRIS